MSTKDILLYESGNGGDIAIENNDIMLCEQLTQQVYLCLFGGNIEASTLGNEPAGQIRQDWWGNSELFSDNKPKQFNSETERELKTNALNSIGRVNIIRAIDKDLTDFKTVADVVTDVILTGTDQIEIRIKITEPGANKALLMRLLWDNAKQELITEKII